MRSLALALALLLASPALADMYQDGSNAKFPEARQNLGTGACDPVAEFGADPTGDRDATAAINACAALRGHQQNIRLPVGDFKLMGQVNLSSGQTLSGTGRAATRLVVYNVFDPAAEAVIKLTSGGIDTGAEVKDLGILFIQPDDIPNRAAFLPLGSCAAAATGCQYPPAILMEGARPRISNVRISKAWTGIVAKASAGWFNSVEISAFHTGLEAGVGFPILDLSHYYGIHFWPFDIVYGTATYGVFSDGQTVGVKFGDLNGANISDMNLVSGKLVIDGDAAGGGFWGYIDGLALDGGFAPMEVVNLVQPGLHISNVYATGDAALGQCRIDIKVGAQFVNITNGMFQGGGTTASPLICVAGRLVLSNSIFIPTHAGQSAVLGQGGQVELHGNSFLAGGTVPIVDMASGNLFAVGNHFPTYASTGASIRLASDSAAHYLADNNTNVWPVTFGFATAGPLLGYYDLGDQSFSAAGIAASFATPGNSVLTTSASGGYYFLRGDFVEGGADIIFASNAYTTASGALRLKVPGMPAPQAGVGMGCAVSQVAYIAVASVPACNINGALGFEFSKVNSLAAMTNVTTADVPASFGNFSLRLGWRYRIR